MNPSPTRDRPLYSIGFIRTLCTVVIWTVILSPSRASDLPRINALREKAIHFENRSAWLEACRAWDEILKRDRTSSYAREGYQRCLRRLHLATRHADSIYRDTVARLSLANSLDTYEQVLSAVNIAYPDRSRTSFSGLFQQGLRELQLALDEPQFRRNYLSGVKPSAIAAFKKRLATWSSARITTIADAREEVMAVIRSAPRDGVTLRPGFASAIGMEFAAGACNALDEHSAFLSPGTLALIQAALRGDVVGVGVEVGIVNDLVQVTRVLEKSPAREEKVEPGDVILSVAGLPVKDLPAEAVADRLRGAAGSTVAVEMVRGTNRRSLKLTRRAVTLPSVERGTLPVGADGTQVGYIRINHFQESTLQEVKEALTSLVEPGPMAEPVKGLILDLRGNPGGVFKSALAVTELFLPDGLIVIGQSPFKEYNQPFKVEGTGANLLPLVVLIDHDTASAAEVVAVALKEGRVSRPNTLILGQTSYGKASIQCLIPLDKAPLAKLAGIRLTVARLLSPSGQPWSGRGIAPDIISGSVGKALLVEAASELQEMIAAMMMTRTMPEPQSLVMTGSSY